MNSNWPDITLHYRPNQADGPWFMSTKATDTPKGKGQYKKISADAGEDGVFVFTIKTPNINFDAKNPIEISFRSGRGPGNTDQFTPKLIAPNVLEVTDDNIEAELTEYYYKLNFDGKPPLDPIIQNGCCLARSSGGTVMTMLSSPAGIALAIVAAVAIAMVARKIWAR